MPPLHRPLTPVATTAIVLEFFTATTVKRPWLRCTSSSTGW